MLLKSSILVLLHLFSFNSFSKVFSGIVYPFDPFGDDRFGPLLLSYLGFSTFLYFFSILFPTITSSFRSECTLIHLLDFSVRLNIIQYNLTPYSLTLLFIKHYLVSSMIASMTIFVIFLVLNVSRLYCAGTLSSFVTNTFSPFLIDS